MLLNNKPKFIQALEIYQAIKLTPLKSAFDFSKDDNRCAVIDKICYR